MLSLIGSTTIVNKIGSQVEGEKPLAKSTDGKFETEERVLREVSGRIFPLLSVVSEQTDDNFLSEVSEKSFVSESNISVATIPLTDTGEDVTHIQLTSPESTITVVHQVEPGRTYATHDGARSETYVIEAQNGDVDTQSCFYNDSCCGGDSDCEDYGDYYYVYKEKCCCCGSNEGYCYWTEMSECCTDYEGCP